MRLHYQRVIAKPEKRAAPIRVAIVEDDDWMRQDLAHEIGSSAGLECLGSYRTAEEALKAIPSKPPDVVLLDINLPGMNGIECLRRLKRLCPETQFLILTVYEESEKIFDSLLAGACGYLLKRTSTDEVLNAIRQAHEGGSPMSRHIA